MRRRRHRHHHAQALTAALALAIGVAAAIPATGADVACVAASGPVHRVAVEMLASGNTFGATQLRHTVQNPDGSVESRVVPGTDDVTVEREPALAIDPVTDAPILVWGRNAGSGFELWITRFAGGSWSAPHPIYADGADNSQAEIRVGTAEVQVFWRQDTPGAPRRLRLVLDRDTLAPQLGPEDLPGGAPDSSATGTPTADLVYYASDLPGTVPGDPGHLVIWGARDEPVPIVYRQSFSLPSEGLRIRHCTAEWIADRLVLSFVSGSSFYYTSRVGESWTDLRLIALGNGVYESRARLMLRDMVRREDSIPTP